MKKITLLLLLLMPISLFAKKRMTPELLWSLGQVSAVTTSPDNQKLIYRVNKVDVSTEKRSSAYYMYDLSTGEVLETDILNGKQFVQWDQNGLFAMEEGTLMKSTDEGKSWSRIYAGVEDGQNFKVSPDGNWLAFSKKILGEKVLGKDLYDDAKNSQVYVYSDLNYRHWDYWNDGMIEHVFVVNIQSSRAPIRDIMEGELYESPQKPFGGAEDFIFSPDSKSILYVSKKKTGKEYAQSTNTDIYEFNLESGATTNWTEGMMGYDVNPKFSPDGRKIAWKSMKRDGYEADKSDIIVMDINTRQQVNLTANWNETADGNYIWANNSTAIYFTASFRGTQQLFSVLVPSNLITRRTAPVRQITEGKFNINSVIAENNNEILVSRTDFNHASEIFAIAHKDILPDQRTEKMRGISKVNDSIYENIEMGESTLRMVETRDGEHMGVWVIYPPNFDPNKKYPTLLYCQGGPQSALSQFYSIRWNFQLMAAHDYIIVAPNRRGMPGWGVNWNEVISKNWGAGPMNDYLDAIDELAKEPYVDNDRLAAVGASFGGYSVFMLAGMHENRFKSFISHNGLFDMRSWYGTTEELFFANWDLGGNYWEKPTPKAFDQYNPSNYVEKWNTPILIIQGGKDYRVPIEQGLQAFQAAQLKDINSKLLYFPDENHWVLKPHNGLVWQREFFNWLEETLKK